MKPTISIINHPPNLEYMIQGMGVILNTIISHMEMMPDNSIPYINMDYPRHIFYEQNGVDGIKNVWEYYFKQHIYPSDEYPQVTIASKEHGYKTPSRLSIGFNIDLNNKQLIETAYTIAKKWIQTKENINVPLNKYKELYFRNKKILGVHIRGTDKKIEAPEINNDMWINEIETSLKTNEIDNIFVATDEQKYVDLLKNKFGSLIISLDHIRSLDGRPVQYNKLVEMEKYNYTIGLQCIIDILLLSECDYFICNSSNVSVTSIILNGNKYKWMKRLKI